MDAFLHSKYFLQMEGQKKRLYAHISYLGGPAGAASPDYTNANATAAPFVRNDFKLQNNELNLSNKDIVPENGGAGKKLFEKWTPPRTFDHFLQE